MLVLGPLRPSPGAADQLDEGRRMLREAKQLAPSTTFDVLVTIAGVQAAAGDLTGALATAADLDELERRWWALKDIAEAQARMGDLAGALHTANTRQNAGWRDATLKAVATDRAEGGDVAGALAVISTLPDPRVDTLGRRLGAVGLRPGPGARRLRGGPGAACSWPGATGESPIVVVTEMAARQDLGVPAPPATEGRG